MSLKTMKTNLIGWLLFVARNQLGVDDVILSVRDPVFYRFRIIRSTGRFTTPKVESVSAADNFCDQVSDHDAAVSVTGIDTETDPHACTFLKRLHATSCFGTPVHDPDGKTIASLAAIETHPRDWSSNDQRDLEQVARLLEAILPAPKTRAGYSLMDFFPIHG